MVLRAITNDLTKHTQFSTNLDFALPPPLSLLGSDWLCFDVIRLFCVCMLNISNRRLDSKHRHEYVPIHKKGFIWCVCVFILFRCCVVLCWIFPRFAD